MVQASPRELVPERGTRGMKRVQRRVSCGGAHGGCAPTPTEHPGFDYGGRRGGGPGGRGWVDPRSYFPHDPFDSASGDASIFELGLIPDMSHAP